MTVADEWGQDPSIQKMRRVFRGMELAQENLLKEAGISPLHAGLRHWREKARACFDRAWAQAVGRGLESTNEIAATIYVLCLVRVMDSDGVNIPEKALPDDERIRLLVREILP